MKTAMKRAFAILLLVAMCIGLMPAVEFSAQAATVDYVYAGNYIKNWGVRGTTATFLSQNAENFYETNGTSYAALSALSGADSTSAVPGSALYQELHELMYDNLKEYTTYEETKDLFQYTDCQNSGKTTNKISSFYSGTSIGPAWDSGSTWNREHVWPNSKSNGGSNSNTRRETDIMMLRPSSISENSSRGNTAYGESSSYYHPNGESNGALDLRGDVARTVLYVYTCWGGSSDYHDGAQNYMWGTTGVIESKEVLLKWMAEDPVDTWELGRNDAVQSITGTRNVFVDYPELAFCLFNAQIPADLQSPSGSSAASQYTITASSNNTAWGTVSVSGNVINASPKTGYAVAGYTIVSGTAQVTQNGTAFTVKATSDVTVQINFTARSQNTVRFVQMGQEAYTMAVYSGDTLQLPAHTGSVPAGYSFAGWVTSTVDKTQTAPAFLKAGDSYTPGSTTLYALYAQSDSSGSEGNAFEPYSGALTEGDYLIVYDDNAMRAALTDKKRLMFTAVNYADGKIISPDADLIWHFAAADTCWTMYNEAAMKYAGGTGVKNVAGLLDSVTDFAKWTYVDNGDGTCEFINKGNSDKGVNPMLRKNAEVGFACYATNTNVGGPNKLYKRAAGTVWYLTGETGEVVVSDNSGNQYDSLTAALAGVADQGKLTLLQNISEDVTITKNVTIDLDGFSIDGTVTVSDGYTLWGMDNNTDDYTVNDEEGYGKIEKILCQGTGTVTGLPESSSLTANGYLMVTETDGVSFHCVDLHMVSMSLRTTKAGIYYKSNFSGDELVAKNVDYFGVALSIVAVPEAATMEVNCGYSKFLQFTPGSQTSESTSTLLKGIVKTTNTAERNETNANTLIYGRAYLHTQDGRYIFGEVAQRDLRQQTEAADAMWKDLSDSQKEGLRQMYNTYEDVMESWTLPNLKDDLQTQEPDEPTPDEPAETGFVKVTAEDQLTDGQYVLVLDAGYAVGVHDAATKWLTAVQPTVVDDVIAEPSGCVWTLDFTDDKVTLTDENGVTVAPSGGNTNGIKAGDYQWTVSFTDGKVIFAGVGDDTVYLAANKSSDYKFRGYKITTAAGNATSYPYQFTLYKNTNA